MHPLGLLFVGNVAFFTLGVGLDLMDGIYAATLVLILIGALGEILFKKWAIIFYAGVALLAFTTDLYAEAVIVVFDFLKSWFPTF